MSDEKKVEETKEPEVVEEEKKDDLAFFDDFSFVKPQRFTISKPKTDGTDVPPHQQR